MYDKYFAVTCFLFYESYIWTLIKSKIKVFVFVSQLAMMRIKELIKSADS